jgi:hypothetical protein
MLLRSVNKGPPNFAQWGAASSAAISAAALRTHNSTPMGAIAEGSFGSRAEFPASNGLASKHFCYYQLVHSTEALTPPLTRSPPGPPMTLGNAAAARVRLIV